MQKVWIAINSLAALVKNAKIKQMTLDDFAAKYAKGELNAVFRKSLWRSNLEVGLDLSSG